MVFEVSAEERRTGHLAPDKLGAVVEAIESQGFAVVGAVVSTETCQLLNASILEDTAIVRASGETTAHEQRTGSGHLQLGLRRYAPYVRADLVANPIIEQVVAAILGRGAWLGFYNGNVNCPGSTHQPVHFDRPFSWKSPEEAAAAGQSWPPPTTTLSCSVALNAITADTGPTDIYPGSHRETAVVDWPQGKRVSEEPELLAQWDPPASMLIPAGGVCFRDPRMWHRGVPNPADTPRPMIAVTYHSPLARHRRGLLQPDLSAASVNQLDADPTLRVLDDGRIGDGRLVFQDSAQEAFESTPNLHGIQRNVRFVSAPRYVNHFVDAHLVGGARIVDSAELSPLP